MLSHQIDCYVALQRAMGFKYRSQNCLLQHFARYAEKCGDSYVRCQTVLDWAGLAPSPLQKRNRMLTVRRFSLAMQSEDARYEVPPADAFGRCIPECKIRHIFSQDDIDQLLRVSLQLMPGGSIRPLTYMTLFALLSVTGLRISEAIALNLNDFTEDGLVINATKFRKDRLVPLHQSTSQAIEYYLHHRKKVAGIEPALFVSNNSARLPYSTVNSIFLQLVRAIGLRGKPGESGVCLHDLRHTFAVRSLEQCIGSRTEVSRHMTALSTYLGHAHVSDTYWYLQATPALLAQISTAQEACYGRIDNDRS